MHCTGDAAVRLALDCYELTAAESGPGSRNAVEHVELVHPDDLARFGQLGVIASMQPVHLALEEGEKPIRVGPERARYEWPTASILHAGGVLALGTDYPVYDFSPFPTLYAAVTRRGPDGRPWGQHTVNENLTLAEALRAYTWGGAYAHFMEDKTGTLEPGKYADITVFDRNLFDLPPEAWLEATTTVTLLEGEIVHDAR